MTEWNWDTREEWAKRVRTAYFDSMPEPSTELSDYASEEEVSRAIAELQQLWRQYGRTMRELKARAPYLAHQPGETVWAWNKRYYAMSEDDRLVVEAMSTPQERRRSINRIIADLRDGTVPFVVGLPPDDRLAIFNMIMQRHEDARSRTRETYVEKVAKTPIDDEAWERELQWRREVETQGLFSVNYG
jgi:hypothetical protein